MAAAEWIAKALARLEILEQEREGLETEKSTSGQVSWSQDQARRLKRIEIEIEALYSKLEAVADEIESDASEGEGSNSEGDLSSAISMGDESSLSDSDQLATKSDESVETEQPTKATISSGNQDATLEAPLNGAPLDSIEESKEMAFDSAAGSVPTSNPAVAVQGKSFSASESAESDSEIATSLHSELRSDASKDNRERAVAIEKLRASRGEGKSSGYAKSSSFASLATSSGAGIGVGVATNDYSRVPTSDPSSRVQTAARAAARANTVEAMKANLRAKSRRTLQPLNTHAADRAVEQASATPAQITTIEQGEAQQQPSSNLGSSSLSSTSTDFASAKSRENLSEVNSEEGNARSTEMIGTSQASVDRNGIEDSGMNGASKALSPVFGAKSYERELYDMEESDVLSSEESVEGSSTNSVQPSLKSEAESNGPDIDATDNVAASLAPTVPELSSVRAEDEGNSVSEEEVGEADSGVPSSVALESTPSANPADTIPEEFGILSPIAQNVQAELEAAEAQAQAMQAALDKAKEIEQAKASAVERAADQHSVAEQQMLEAQRAKELAVQAELEAQTQTLKTQEAAQAVAEQLEMARNRLAFLQENAEIMERLYSQVSVAEERVESIKQEGDKAIEALSDANKLAQEVAMRAVEETEAVHLQFEEAQSRAEEAVELAEQANTNLLEAQERFSSQLAEAEGLLEQAKEQLERRFRQVEANEMNEESVGQEEVSNSSDYNDYSSAENLRPREMDHGSDHAQNNESFANGQEPVQTGQTQSHDSLRSARTTQFKTQTQTQEQIQSRQIVRRKSDPAEIENPFATRESRTSENQFVRETADTATGSQPDVFAALVDESEEWSTRSGLGKWKWIAAIAVAVGALVVGVVAIGGSDSSTDNAESKTQLESKDGAKAEKSAAVRTANPKPAPPPKVQASAQVPLKDNSDNTTEQARAIDAKSSTDSKAKAKKSKKKAKSSAKSRKSRSKSKKSRSKKRNKKS